MGDPYRELIDNGLTVEQIIDVEEKRFGRTLEQGTDLLDGDVARLRAPDGPSFPATWPLCSTIPTVSPWS